MKINNFRGDLNDVSAWKEPLFFAIGDRQIHPNKHAVQRIDFVFKKRYNIYWILWSRTDVCRPLNKDNFRGDLADSSAEIEPLVQSSDFVFGITWNVFWDTLIHCFLNTLFSMTPYFLGDLTDTSARTKHCFKDDRCFCFHNWIIHVLDTLIEKLFYLDNENE